jgi:hypothetical protein
MARFLKYCLAAAFLGFFVFGGEVRAAELVSECTAQTRRSFRLTESAAVSCGAPYGVKISRLVLEYELDQGGDIYLNGAKVVSLGASGGSKTGRMNVALALIRGSRVDIWIDAVNGRDSGGLPDGQVFGRATLEFWGNQSAAAYSGSAAAPSSPGAAAPGPSEPARQPYADVRFRAADPYPPGPDFSWLKRKSSGLAKASAKPAASPPVSWELSAGASQTLGRMPWYAQAIFIIIIAILFAAVYFYYRYGKSKGLIGGTAK